MTHVPSHGLKSCSYFSYRLDPKYGVYFSLPSQTKLVYQTNPYADIDRHPIDHPQRYPFFDSHTYTHFHSDTLTNCNAHRDINSYSNQYPDCNNNLIANYNTDAAYFYPYQASLWCTG